MAPAPAEAPRRGSNNGKKITTEVVAWPDLMGSFKAALPRAEWVAAAGAVGACQRQESADRDEVFREEQSELRHNKDRFWRIAERLRAVQQSKEILAALCPLAARLLMSGARMSEEVPIDKVRVLLDYREDPVPPDEARRLSMGDYVMLRAGVERPSGLVSGGARNLRPTELGVIVRDDKDTLPYKVHGPSWSAALDRSVGIESWCRAGDLVRAEVDTPPALIAIADHFRRNGIEVVWRFWLFEHPSAEPAMPWDPRRRHIMLPMRGPPPEPDPLSVLAQLRCQVGVCKPMRNQHPGAAAITWAIRRATGLCAELLQEVISTVPHPHDTGMATFSEYLRGADWPRPWPPEEWNGRQGNAAGVR